MCQPKTTDTSFRRRVSFHRITTKQSTSVSGPFVIRKTAVSCDRRCPKNRRVFHVYFVGNEKLRSRFPEFLKSCFTFYGKRRTHVVLKYFFVIVVFFSLSEYKVINTNERRSHFILITHSVTDHVKRVDFL